MSFQTARCSKRTVLHRSNQYACAISLKPANAFVRLEVKPLPNGFLPKVGVFGFVGYSEAVRVECVPVTLLVRKQAHDNLRWSEKN